jgi:hypothetical protein
MTPNLRALASLASASPWYPTMPKVLLVCAIALAVTGCGTLATAPDCIRNVRSNATADTTVIVLRAAAGDSVGYALYVTPKPVCR